MTEAQTPRYFVFDWGKNENDIEFIIHNWHRRSFNRARPGDYFLYRRLAGTSESKKSYFFGSGRVGRIEEDSHGEINCLVDNPIPFRNPVYGEDILDSIKERTKLNRYGMTTIESEVFKHIFKLGVAVRE